MYIRGTLKELSLENILGNGNCQIYCWNLHRLCTSRDYNCGLPDATADSVALAMLIVLLASADI